MGKNSTAKFPPDKKNPPQNFLKTKNKRFHHKVASSKKIKIPSHKFQNYLQTKIKDSPR